MAAPLHAADVIVIGAGIAGASAAAVLAASARVILLERESQPGWHSTGRSAATFSTVHGPAPIRALTRASGAFLAAPPPGFAPLPLLTRRPVILIGRADQTGTVQALQHSLGGRGGTAILDGAALRRRMPLLRPGYAACGLVEPMAADIDVSALHQGWLRQLKTRGGMLHCRAPVQQISRRGADWRLETPVGRFAAPVIVNAAGAWADELAQLAGLAPLGLVPRRRTVVVVDAPGGSAPADWPMIVDCDERFYLKPDARRLLLSPADETPSPPTDARPEELDIAICLDRIGRAFDVQPSRIVNAWAGLRSFVADGLPVVGHDSAAPGFVWLAAQGGYGIQTAPAMAELAAALVTGAPLPPALAAEGLDPAALAPGRAGLSRALFNPTRVDA